VPLLRLKELGVFDVTLDAHAHLDVRRVERDNLIGALWHALGDVLLRQVEAVDRGAVLGLVPATHHDLVQCLVGGDAERDRVEGVVGAVADLVDHLDRGLVHHLELRGGAREVADRAHQLGEVGRARRVLVPAAQPAPQQVQHSNLHDLRHGSRVA
jgi:hypothetical protein